MKNLNDMTDEQLALSYIDGNNRAFDLLLSRNQSKLYSYILFVVHDRDLADDVFQETFVKVISKLQAGRYTACGKFSAGQRADADPHAPTVRCCSGVRRYDNGELHSPFRQQVPHRHIHLAQD